MLINLEYFRFSLTKDGKELAEKLLLNFEISGSTSTFRNDYCTTDLNSKSESFLAESRSLSPLKYKTFSSANIQEELAVKSDSVTLSSSHVHISYDSNDSLNSTPHKNFADFHNVDLTEFNDVRFYIYVLSFILENYILTKEYCCRKANRFHLHPLK